MRGFFFRSNKIVPLNVVMAGTIISYQKIVNSKAANQDPITFKLESRQVLLEFLEKNNFEFAKKIYNDTNVYGLKYTGNIYHIDEWEIFKDIIDIVIENNFNKFVYFYENFVKNIENQIRKEEGINTDETIKIYDCYWKQKITIDYNIREKFQEMLFMKISNLENHPNKQIYLDYIKKDYLV